MTIGQVEGLVEHRVSKLDLSLTPDLAATFALAAKAGRAYQSTVMILGETGVGKTAIARHIHDTSVRADKPFVKIDLSQATASLFEDELFGHSEGAYTGAKRGRKSRLSKANGGTVFLDEIGTLSFDLQARLLRLVQERTFSPLGSDEEITIDVRFLAATSRNLEEMVKSGEFREDLYHRLKVLEIFVPPLRDRKNDIIPLAEHFLRQASLTDRILQKQLSDEAKVSLLGYNWPGNVRSLENEMNRATIIVDGDIIGAEDLSFFGKADALSSNANKIDDIILKISRLNEFPKIEELYNLCIRYVIGYSLEENKFSKERTSRFLGINVNTFSSRISVYFDLEKTNRNETETAIAQWNQEKIDIPELPFLEEIVREVIRGRVISTNCIGEIDNIFYQAKTLALKETLIENKFVQAYAAKSLDIHPTTVSTFIKSNPELKEWIDKARASHNQSPRPLQIV